MMRWMVLGVSALLSAILVEPALAGSSSPIPGMPANVRAVMQKLQSGQAPSPADEKLLEQWSKSVSQSLINGKLPSPQPAPGGAASVPPKGAGGGAGGAAGGHELSLDSGVDENPCVGHGHVTGLGATPSQATYLAMAKNVLQTYEARLPADARTKLEEALDKSHDPTAGSDIAPMMMVIGKTSTAVVSAAYAAVRAPQDALSANNLGAMLRGAKDYTHAAVALKYALSLAPKSPMVATNLGWLAMSGGDHATAGRYFKMAVGEDPHMSPALSGQALLSECAGNFTAALPLYRSSLMAGYSDLAAEGIDAAEKVISDRAKGASDVDLGPPDAYGPKSGGHIPQWPRPPLPKSVLTMVGYADPKAPVNTLLRYQLLFNKAVLASEAASGLGDFADSGPHTIINGKSVLFKRGYDKEVFILGDIKTILQKELNKPHEDADAKLTQLPARLGCCGASALNTTAPSCSYQREMIALYPQYYAAFNTYWDQLQKALGDLWGFSTPWIARIHDPVVARAQMGILETDTLMYLQDYAGELLNFGMVTYAAYTYHLKPCGAAASVQAGTNPQGKVKSYKIDATKCRTPPVFLPFLFAAMSANCDKMEFSLGDGLGVNIEYKFAPDYVVKNGVYTFNGADGQWTVFAGGKLSTPAGSPAKASVSLGPYISFQGGHMTDYGLEDKASAGLNLGGMQLRANETVRLGAVGGVQASPSFTFNGVSMP